jgi:hypothetical protein
MTLNIMNIPIPKAVQFKTPTVLDRSDTGIVSSKPARGKDVCPPFSSVMLSSVGRGLTMRRSPIQVVEISRRINFKKLILI